MQIINKILLGLGIFAILMCVAIFRPVPIVKESKCLVTQGVVSGVYEGGTHDVVFRLENDRTRYYINRGLEQGLNLRDLQSKLIGQEIVIKYPKYWTPLDWDNSIRHLSKLELGSAIIFNECREG